ncbi:MAG: imidazolonepropionase [Proteobacteria bacterium]|nr:imidazolonepropionase [Pseudomonadota bacterium]
MKKKSDLLIVNASQILTMEPELAGPHGTDPEARELGVIEDGAVAVGSGRILDVGGTASILEFYDSSDIIDASGSIISPGLVDPHTHLVFAGSRHIEFGMRMRGATYHEILEAGGGIHSTVQATRAASLDELVSLALPRLKTLLTFGVTTAEVKSGYGLDIDNELKMLLAIKKLSSMQPVQLVPTYLGAHVVPLEFRDRRDAYVRLITREVIPEIARQDLAKACDVFCDEGAFTLDEASKILRAASENGLLVKIHAGQFTEQGGPQLVAQMGGLSADHLELISKEGIAAMADAGIVANLLPGAAFSLCDHFPDGRRLIDGGVTVAVATDDNPGTSRTENLPLMASMAVTQMGLTSPEAWKAITKNAAKALGMEDQVGAVAPGLRADLVIFSVPDFRAFLYHFGLNHAAVVVAGGQIAI